jgi:hypothetical protein
LGVACCPKGAAAARAASPRPPSLHDGSGRRWRLSLHSSIRAESYRGPKPAPPSPRDCNSGRSTSPRPPHRDRAWLHVSGHRQHAGGLTRRCTGPAHPSRSLRRAPARRGPLAWRRPALAMLRPAACLVSEGTGKGLTGSVASTTCPACVAGRTPRMRHWARRHVCAWKHLAPTRARGGGVRRRHTHTHARTESRLHRLVPCGTARQATPPPGQTFKRLRHILAWPHAPSRPAAGAPAPRPGPAPAPKPAVPRAASGGGAAAASPSSDGANMGAVLAAVGVACCGAFAFGYHLGVVNGPLEQIAKELGFAGNKALQGLVRRWLGPGAGSARTARAAAATPKGPRLCTAAPNVGGSRLCRPHPCPSARAPAAAPPGRQQHAHGRRRGQPRRRRLRRRARPPRLVHAVCAADARGAAAVRHRHKPQPYGRGPLPVRCGHRPELRAGAAVHLRGAGKSGARRGRRARRRA